MFASLKEQIEGTEEKISAKSNLLRYALIVVVSAAVFIGALMGIMLLE
jgi:hypothetical protein